MAGDEEQRIDQVVGRAFDGPDRATKKELVLHAKDAALPHDWVKWFKGLPDREFTRVEIEQQIRTEQQRRAAAEGRKAA